MDSQNQDYLDKMYENIIEAQNDVRREYNSRIYIPNK